MPCALCLNLVPCTLHPLPSAPNPVLQPHRRHWDRWLMMGMIGILTGVVAHLLYLVGVLLTD